MDRGDILIAAIGLIVFAIASLTGSDFLTSFLGAIATFGILEFGKNGYGDYKMAKAVETQSNSIPKLNGNEILERERRLKKYRFHKKISPIFYKFENELNIFKTNMKNLPLPQLPINIQSNKDIEKKVFEMFDQFIFLYDSYGERAKDQLLELRGEIYSIIKKIETLNDQFLTLYNKNIPLKEVERVLELVDATLSIEND